MSGFCGFTGGAYQDQNAVITRMTERIKHRGPDGMGVHIDPHITLGARYLGSFDTQPIYNEDRSLALVFDGALYDTASTRQFLESKGHVFATDTDGELLLHLYEETGEGLFEHLRGMFAFLIYDFQKEQIFAARDFFGIKPFFYAVIDGEFVFASEIKSFLEYPGFRKELNQEALEQYLSFQYSVLPETFFKGVYRLLPSHSLTFQGGTVTTKQYWQAMFAPDETKTMDACVDEIDRVVMDSVALHEVADTEIGSCLSSGVDSSYIAATFHGKKTFTVGWEKNSSYSELQYAQNLSAHLGIENYHKIISADEYFGSFGRIQYHLDEPLADPAAVALYFVCEVASQHVKIAFSGEGADEFFAGYNIYGEPLGLRPITRLPMPIRRLLGGLAKLLPAGVKGRNFLIRGSQTVEERFIGNAKIFTAEERGQILKHPTAGPPTDVTKPYYDQVKHLGDVQKMQYIDLNLWGPGDILQKADRMSAAHSLTIRCPLLDREVFRVAASIPTRLLVDKQTTKRAFRMAAKRHLPEAVASKEKLGFPVPTRVWLREERYYGIVKAAFESDVAREFFRTEALLALLDEHRSGKADHGRKIWTVYTFLVWYGEFFGSAERATE
ncbi:MAG: asparagine synthase (glutamine-hydrolyzing) [Oscillospiraceae bacterium]|nr:asparagine synthase (glutamine-hydrolyzing) [Oscillospiraceae bacterium]